MRKRTPSDLETHEYGRLPSISLDTEESPSGSKITRTLEEDAQTMDAGYKFVIERDSYKLWRKRK